MIQFLDDLAEIDEKIPVANLKKRKPGIKIGAKKLKAGSL